MRAIVTGGAGFIGSHLIEALVDRGDDVVCLDRPDANPCWIEQLPITRIDTRLEATDDLGPVLAGADVVFHLAGITSARGPADYYRVNTEATARVADAIAGLPNPRPRMVFLSSLAAVGPNRGDAPLTPDSIPYPLSHYGHSKLLAEQVLHSRSDRVESTIIRLPSVYGPRERGVLTFFRLVQHGVALTVGRWDRRLSMIYVEDAVRGIVAAALAPDASHRTYCLAHATPVTWRAFAAAVGEALGRRPRLWSLKEPVGRLIASAAELAARARGAAALLNREKLREIVATAWVCDPSRAARELGFQAGVGIGPGTAMTADWYRQARWL